ncbi:MAG: ABC transporter permease [Candidatus Symbiothrix sp.]|jgi:putative ABC transport system permease protein|nr:ABC transporter permease [Candidatus Symbiothrix sp.]
MNSLQNFLFVLKRFTTSSLINILGLSVALIVFFVVLLQVYYDFTFDRGYTNADKIVQFNIFQSDENETGISTNINFQIPAQINDRLPEVEAFCMLYNAGEGAFDIDKEGDNVPETHQMRNIYATQGFWKVFSPKILWGDTTGIFSAPGSAMISEKTAQRLFGTENPVGKNIRYHYGNGQKLTILAVYRDFPENASLNNGVYTYLPEQSKSEWSYSAYFLISPDNLATANEKIDTKDFIEEEIIKYLEEHPEMIYQIQLSSLNDLYLNNSGNNGKRINTTLSLLAIGILTLLIAFVNFVNLSLAMAPSRVRGINIRKILGVNKMSLRFTIAMESVLFTVLSITIAFMGMYMLKGSVFAQELFPTIDFSLWSHAGVLATASGVILLLAFAIGLYTMRYSTSFDESEALKGSFAVGVKGIKLRNVLITVQFATAIVLICISIFIKKQNDYMMNYDWGIPKENIVYLPLAGLGESAQSFGQELLRDPRINDYCITRALPGRVEMSWGRQFEGQQISLFVWSVDDRFFDFFDINIVAGRKPEHIDSIVCQIVVNEAFLKKYKFDESIVGKDFNAFGPGRIQAIAKNINFQSLHDSIVPMAFGVLSQWQQFQYFLVKFTGSEIPSTIQHIEQTWTKFSKEPFNAHFLDEDMDKLYQKESNMAKLIGLFGFIIVIIAVMGVYGLILFNTKYKAKEIAIRKVNGSSITEIMLMLNRSILIQLGIAFIIAIPIAYYVTYKWFENFAYKTTIYWWVFLLGGAIILIITLLTVSVRSYQSASVNPTKALNKE